MKGIDTYSTYIYNGDWALFEHLGLKPFADVPVWTKHKCGRVKLDGGSYVDVTVEGAPAQFWQFNIYDAESKRHYAVRTGSGGFVDYWPSIEKMATGMIVVVAATAEGPEDASVEHPAQSQ